MQKNHLAYVFLFLTTLFWGGNAVAGKLAVGHVSPMLLTSLRWGLALFFFLLVGGAQFWRERHKILPQVPLLALYGALGFAAFNIALYSALKYTSAINVAIEQAAVPAVIFLLSFVLFRTKVTILQVFGFSLSLIGVAVVASNGSFARLAALEINRGDMFMALGVIVYSVYSVLLRYRPDLHWKTMMIVMSFAALIISLPFAFFEMRTDSGIVPDTQGWLVVLYAALFPAMVSQVLWIKGVDMIGANRAGIFINLVPILGTILAIVVLGEAFEFFHAIAIVLVIGGIWIAENSGRRQAQAAGE